MVPVLSECKDFIVQLCYTYMHTCILARILPHMHTHTRTHHRMVGSDFAAAVVLITMGALLGRVSHFQLIIVAFFEIMFYSANEALNIHVLKASDIGGSMLIHTFGAYFGIAASLALFHQKARDHSRNSSVYHSDLFSMIGEKRECPHLKSSSSIVSYLHYNLLCGIMILTYVSCKLGL